MEKHPSQTTTIDIKTRKFIRSRKIGAILPWLAILVMLILVFSLVMSGLPTFLTELGFIATFYYFIDSYNWLADRLLFDPKKRIITHARDNLVQLILWLTVAFTLITTILFIWLRKQSFLDFIAGVFFISIIYFGSRAMENFLVIAHIQLHNWHVFYRIVASGTIFLTIFAALLLYFNIVAYYIYFGAISLIYLLTYYILIEFHRRVEDDPGGHKYFIDLPDNRFANKYRY